ncbi:MAG: hypothetical protein WB974_05120, partial [Acidobacteriaceae bacterium]
AAPSDFNACGTEFLLRELELALTFMDFATVSIAPERTQHAHARAAHAHQTVLRFLPSVRPGPEQNRIIQRNLARLESRMTVAGLSTHTTLST